MRLIYLGSAFVTGVLLGSRVHNPALLLALLAVSAALFLSLIPLRRPRFLLAGLCILVLLGGALRYAMDISREDVLSSYNSLGTVETKGVVASDPEPVRNLTRFRLDVKEIRADGQWKTVEGSALVQARPSSNITAQRDGPYFRYGDLLRLRGKLEEPPTLGEFDYREYLARQGISSLMYYPQVELLESGKGLRPLEWVYALRWRMADSLSLSLPEPQASLAQALILGMRSTLPSDFKESLFKTGTTHIIAISGMNISIVIGIVASFGLWCFGRRRNLHLFFALVATWGYAILAGMSPSVVRAAIMGSLYLWALALGRQRAASVALVASAAVMVALDPRLLWDVSFQLSFLAMAGLIFLAPLIQSAGARAIEKLWPHGDNWTYRLATLVNESTAVTLGATLATLPIIAFNFHSVSLMGVPATLLILPAFPFLLVTSFLAAFAGILLPVAGQVVGWATWLGLSYMMLVVEIFSRVPLAAAATGFMPEALAWAYYAVLGASLWVAHARPTPFSLYRRLLEVAWGQMGVLAHPLVSKLTSKWSILPLGAATILVWSAALTAPDGLLHVSFLDIGQGDATLIQVPSGKKVLIDGGPTPQGIGLELGEKLPFWDRTIDLVVLTHPHEDHLAGLLEVLLRYRVKGVMESGTPYSSPVYEEWLSLLKKKGIPVTKAVAGQEIRLGKGVKLVVLNPQEVPLEGTAADEDNNSVVLRLEYGGASFLLSGEIQQEAELYLLGSSFELQSTVLKVAHHGSRTSTSTEFLKAVRPQVALISVGAKNRFGHPDPETLAHLKNALPDERIYLTSESGTVEVVSDGRRLWIKKER